MIPVEAVVAVEVFVNAAAEIVVRPDICVICAAAARLQQLGLAGAYQSRELALLMSMAKVKGIRAAGSKLS
jgi:hypothetical protein